MQGSSHGWQTIEVAGGELAVDYRPGPSGGGSPLVILIHGITASSRSWALISKRLAGEVALAAVDLAGRADSAGVGGPFGIRRHAADVVAIADKLGATSVVLVGHSMGGWIAATAAPMLGARCVGVVLVDGGWGLEVPRDGASDQVLETVLGPAMERLSQEFATREDYYQFWKSHPALSQPGVWGDAVTDYLDHDLGPGPGPHRSRVVVDAVRADGIDILMDDSVRHAAVALSVRTELLRVDRGLLDEPSPVIPLESAQELSERNPLVSVTTVPDLNHYTILFAPGGADAVVAAIRRALTTGATSAA